MNELTYPLDDAPVYDTQIRAWQDNDPVHASTVLNPVITKIINNIHAVKQGTASIKHTHTYSSLTDIPPLYIAKTLTGTTAEIQAITAPLDDLKIYGKTTETVTGTKSPDNPSAITGVGGSGNVILAVHGKNHFDHKANYGYTASSGTVSTLKNGIKVVTTASVGKAYAISYADGVSLEANKEYYCRFQVTISGSDGKIRGRIRVGQTDGALITYSPAPGAKDGVYNISFKFTSPSSGLINFQLNYQGEDTYALPAGIAIVWENIIISQTDIPYTPYIGNTYKIPLPTPLYSLPDGTRDVLERKDGQWGVTRRVGSATIDGVTYKAGWVGNEVNGVYQFNVGLPNKLFVNGKNAYSDKFTFVSVTSKDGEGFVGSNADLCLQISKTRTGGIVTSAAATTWLQNNPVFALYSRTEAFEVLLQATQDILNSISTIGGDNIILNGDGAEMSVTVTGSFVHLQDSINKHVTDHSNPHQVTAQQTGAAEADHEHTLATAAAAGFMSAEDKQKLVSGDVETPQTILTKLKTVDGEGSGLDANFLNGQSSGYYNNYANLVNKPTIVSLGGQRKILFGTTAPASSLGQDGDVYIQYS